MKNIITTKRIKIIFTLAVIMLAFFSAPRLAEAIAVKSVSYAREQVNQIIGQSGAESGNNARLLAQQTGGGGGGSGAGNNSTTATQKDSELILTILQILTLILDAIGRIIWPIVFLSGALMENDIIFGGAMGEKLHLMWVQIRNIVNLIFVILLVGIAIYNISGFASERFQIKQILPKIIIGLILVNFSYMIATVVLDAIGVGTNAMFGLPINIVETPNINDEAMKDLCASISYTNKSGKLQGLGQTGQNLLEGQGLCDKSGQATKNLKEFLNHWSPHGATIIMAVELMNMTQLQKAVLHQEITLSNLTINTIFAIVMFLVYGVAFIVLFIVLLGRAIIVWLAIVLSPLLIFCLLILCKKQAVIYKELLKRRSQPL